MLASLCGNAKIAYTDGSCSSSLVPTGSSAYICFPDRSETRLTVLVGIRTNNTAEMNAILLVLRHLLSVRNSFGRHATLCVFADSQYCLGILLLGHDVSTDNTLVSDVFNSVTKWKSFGFAITFHWSPGHCGIDGNDITDKLASMTLDDWNHGYQEQCYGISYATSKALVRSAMYDKSQSLWSSHCVADEEYYDHISQIRTRVGKWKPFHNGVGKQRRALNRVRLGHIHLKAHLYRRGQFDTPLCECGTWESRTPFLMECSLFDYPRAIMYSKVQAITAGKEITIELLLGGCNTISCSVDCAIADAVYACVTATRRFDCQLKDTGKRRRANPKPSLCATFFSRCVRTTTVQDSLRTVPTSTFP